MLEALSAEIKQVESVPEIACQPLSRHELATQLELQDFPQYLLDGICQSNWFSIGDKRIVFEEVHQPQPQTNKLIVISDFDDTILDTTKWHKQELQILENMFGIPQPTSKRLYEASKIFIKGKASKETRYTPKLNLILIEKYLQLKSNLDEDQIWPKLQEYIDLILDKDNIEMFIRNIPIDPRILKMFKENNTQNFVHENFVSKIFNDQNSIPKIIASRGKIEGPLGQIWKIHQSGISKKTNIIMYTNDLKTEVLDIAPKLFPSSNQKIIIYEDNPTEIDDYDKHICKHPTSTCLFGIVHVRHCESKRRDKNSTEAPIFRTDGRIDISHTIGDTLPQTNETIYDIHLPQTRQEKFGPIQELIADIPHIRVRTIPY